MKISLSFIFLLTGFYLFAQKEISQKDSVSSFSIAGDNHVLNAKGFTIAWFLGNGHVTNTVVGIGVKVLKRHHIGFDLSYSTGVDRSDDITDTLGIKHKEGKESRDRISGYTVYYHYHFDLFRLNEKHNLNFFAGCYYQYKKGIHKIDPLYQAEYISKNETRYANGFTIGVSKTIKEVRGLRFEGGLGGGQFRETDDIKFRKDNSVMYKTEKTSGFDFRMELGLYWSFL